MCHVEGCNEKPCGEKTTTFGDDKLKSELCNNHFKLFYEKEDHAHSHQWVSYASVAACLCMLGVCANSLV